MNTVNLDRKTISGEQCMPPFCPLCTAIYSQNLEFVVDWYRVTNKELLIGDSNI